MRGRKIPESEDGDKCLVMSHTKLVYFCLFRWRRGSGGFSF